MQYYDKWTPLQRAEIKRSARALFGVSLSLSLTFFFAACATTGMSTDHVRTVEPGDNVETHFLCKLKTGEIAVATDRLEGGQATLPKSTVFLQRDIDGPVSVTASRSLPPPPGKEWSFESEVINRLGVAVVGMSEGEDRTVSLTAEDAPERRESDYVLKIARVREHPKEMRMSVDEYRLRTGKTPEAGQPIAFDRAVPGRVETATQDEVLIRFTPQAGVVTKTPYGPEHVRDAGRSYEIVIDAEKGALVRTAHLVGSISGVDENYITIDYRNPFGGKTLICDVKVEKITGLNLQKKKIRVLP